MARERATGPSGVRSCLRALDIIDYFQRVGRPARLADVRNALDIPNSSADEILRTLAAGGYLSYDRRTKRYAPSYKLVGTLRGIENGFFGGNEVEALLADLKSETGATVYLTLQNDCWLENVATVEGAWTCDPDAGAWPREVVCFQNGQWRPGTNFAVAVLAQRSNAEIVDLTARAQSLGLGPREPAFMKDLVDRIARARARGFAVSRRHRNGWPDSIAVPLALPNSVAPHAVGIVADVLFENERDVSGLASAMRGVIARHSAGLRSAASAVAH